MDTGSYLALGEINLHTKGLELEYSTVRIQEDPSWREMWDKVLLPYPLSAEKIEVPPPSVYGLSSYWSRTVDRSLTASAQG